MPDIHCFACDVAKRRGIGPPDGTLPHAKECRVGGGHAWDPETRECRICGRSRRVLNMACPGKRDPHV